MKIIFIQIVRNVSEEVNLHEDYDSKLGQFLFQSQEKNMKKEHGARFSFCISIISSKTPENVLNLIDTLSQVAGWGDTGNGFRLS